MKLNSRLLTEALLVRISPGEPLLPRWLQVFQLPAIDRNQSRKEIRSRGRPSLLVFQFNRVHLRLKENLDSICGPNGYACSKKVRIFGPYGTGQSECRGQHGPIILVTTAQALPGFSFKKDIE